MVDDELINCKLLGFIVSRDYEVIYAENGIQALELIRKNERLLYLVPLNLLMPEMDGYELLEILLLSLPRIILSFYSNLY